MKGKPGHGGFDDDFSEIADKKIDWIDQKRILRRSAETVDAVENGGHVHKQLRKNGPQILNVAEKNEQGRQHQPHADVEQHQQRYGIEKKDELPRESNMVDQTKNEKDDKSQAKIDEGLTVFGEEKQILGDVDLGKDRGVAEERRHPLRCGLVEVGEDKIAAEQVSGVVQHGAAEKVGEDKPHDQQHRQRRKNAPSHSENGSFVFFLEIALHQFLKEKLVFFVFFKHETLLALA